MAGFLVFLFVLMTECADVKASVGTHVEYGSNSPNCRHVSYNVHHLHQVSYTLIIDHNNSNIHVCYHDN